MKISTETSAILLESIEQASETFLLTDPEGTIIYANPAFEKVSGYTRQEVIGKNSRLLKSGQHPPSFYKEMWETLKAGRRWNGRITNRRKDGALINEEVRISPILGPDGKPRYFLVLRHDIAREAQLEEQLNHSQKMESMGLLAGQISHDFNNLLTIIIGSMELIGEDLEADSVGARLASEILRSSKETANLIKQLMVFARRQEIIPVLTTLNAPLAELKLMLDNLLGKGIMVSYELAKKPASVRIEPEQFKQAVLNLAVNARHAMGDNGRILIKTYTAGPDEVPPSLKHGTYAVFELSDSGPGIPPEVLPRMFEPFFTTKPKGKGTGLGLSTVYGIINQSGGQIIAANLPKGGAVFTIYFPVAE